MTPDNQPQNRGNRSPRREWLDGYVPRPSNAPVSRPPLTNMPDPARRHEVAEHKRPSRRKEFFGLNLKNILPKRRRRNSLRRHSLRFAILGMVLVIALGIIGSVFLSKPSKVEAAINVRGSGTQTNFGAGTTLSLTVPAETKEGDTIIAVTQLHTTSTSIAITSTGSSFTSILDCRTTGTNTSTTIAAWRRQATSSDAGTSYSFAWDGASRQRAGYIISYSGVDRTTPVEATSACGSGTSGSLTSGTLTTTSANTRIYSVWTGALTDTVLAPAVGITPSGAQAGNGLYAGSITDTSCGIGCRLSIGGRTAWDTQVSASSPGTITRTATANANTQWRGFIFALKPAADPSLNQAAYRWIVDNGATNPSTPLADTNTATVGVARGNTNSVRLRIRVAVSTAELQIDLTQYKLQFVGKGTGSCAAPSAGTPATYTDVTTSTAISYDDTSTPADGVTIAATPAIDPLNAGRTIIPQTFKETNATNIATVAITPSGQDAMWDFALYNNSAPDNTSYCFRIVNSSDGSALNGGYAAYPELNTINLVYEQSAYRWFTNTDAANPVNSSFMAAQDAQITNVKVNDNFRLRMLIHNGGTDAVPVAYENYKLQFAPQSGGSCSGASYTDVATTGTTFIYNNNAAPADEATVSLVTGDPVHSGHTNVYHTYQEANNFTTRLSQPAGQDGLWDFSIKNNSGAIRTTYCFRAVKSDATAFTTYTSYAQLTTQDPRYEQSAFRWATNNDAITPGTALGANNAPITDISQNTIVRLRMLVHVSNDAATASLENFKLQFAARSGTCDTAFSGETYTDLAQGSGEFRYKDITGLSDAATIIANGANDPTHSSDTVVPETYEESNNFTNPTVIPVGQDGMWDFPIVNNSASQNTSWCFRIVKSDATRFDQASGSYTNIAELSTAPAALNQTAYRWFTNIDSSDYLSVASNPTNGFDSGSNIEVDTVGGYMYVGGSCTGCGGAGSSAARLEKRRISDGSLVTEFDGDGIVVIDPSNLSEGFQALAIDTANGYLYVATGDQELGVSDGRWHIEKRRLDNGALCTAANCGTQFGSGGMIVEDNALLLNEFVYDLSVDATNGYLYLVGAYLTTSTNSTARVEKRRTDSGALCTAANCGTQFGTNGAVISDPGIKQDSYRAVELDISGGYVYLGMSDSSPGGSSSFRWRVEKRKTTNGNLCSAAECGTLFKGGGSTEDGVWNGADPSGNNDNPFKELELDITNGHLYVAGEDLGGAGTNKKQWRVEKISASTAAAINAFDTDSIWQYDGVADTDELNDMIYDSGNLYIAGYSINATSSSNQWVYAKINSTSAAFVTAFDSDGHLEHDVSNNSDSINGLYLDPANSLLYAVGSDGVISGTDIRWRVERRSATDGTKAWTPTALAAQDTKGSPASRNAFRLRLLLHVSGENMSINGETLKLQYAPKVGTCDTAFVGESTAYTDVGTASTSDISYYDNSNPTDGIAAVVLTTDPSHIGHTNVLQTYEEQNNFTFPTAVPSGQDGLWEFALVDNSAFGNYCFRVIRSIDTNIAAYSVIPEAVFCDVPKSDNLLRHGNFFCDDLEKKFFWN